MDTKARILLVDDDRAIRKMYTDLFERDGFEVISESSAIDALERITGGEKFDLVVTDIMMARMDGWEFLKVLRQDLGFNSVALPVVVVSAHFDSDRLRAEAFRRGASSTFTKAEPLSRLLHEVRVHSGQMRSRFDDDTNPG